MSSHAVTWLFGKMPAHGDFVSRGLDPETRDALDRWLSDEMIAARQAYGDGFEAAYDGASPWLMVTGEGAGAICPSMDSAGRRFPLLVGRTCNDDGDAARTARGCENAIYRAFADGLAADQLHEALVTELPVDGGAAPGAGWWREENDRLPAARLSGERPGGLITAMLKDFADG